MIRDSRATAFSVFVVGGYSSFYDPYDTSAWWGSFSTHPTSFGYRRFVDGATSSGGGGGTFNAIGSNSSTSTGSTSTGTTSTTTSSPTSGSTTTTSTSSNILFIDGAPSSATTASSSATPGSSNVASSSTLGSGGAKSATSTPLYGGTGSSDHNPSNVLTPGMIGAPNSAFVRIGNDTNAMGSDPGESTSSPRVQPSTPKEKDQALASLNDFLGGKAQPGSAASTQQKLEKRVVEDHNCLNGQVTRKEFWVDPNAPKSVSIPSDQVINLGPSGPQEGINSALEGAVLGGFSDNDTYSSTGAQIVIGLIPIVGQVADVRDAIAAAKHVAEGKKGSTLEAIGAGIGFIPLFGDWAKGFLKGGKKAANVVIKEGVDLSLKHGDDAAKAIFKQGEKTVENGLENAAKKADNAALNSGAPIQGSGGPGKVYEIPGSELKGGKPYIGKTRQPTVADRMKGKDHRAKTPTGDPPKASIIAENLTPDEAAGVEALLIEQRGLDNLTNKIPGLNPKLPKNAPRLEAGKKVLGLE